MVYSKPASGLDRPAESAEGFEPEDESADDEVVYDDACELDLDCGYDF